MDPFEIPEEIARYAEDHTTGEDPVLSELYRQTYLNTVHPQMMSGKVQGQLLRMISRLIVPSRILEIGTFTGYSAYCLAAGLKEGGKLITIEVDEELAGRINTFFDQAGILHKVKLITGDARKIIPDLEGPFDLVFLDANKEDYPEYYEQCIQKIADGGYLVADNVLWGGKVVHPGDYDPAARALHQFNTLVKNDDRVEQVFLTIRDGLLLIRKKNV